MSFKYAERGGSVYHKFSEYVQGEQHEHRLLEKRVSVVFRLHFSSLSFSILLFQNIFTYSA